MPNAGTFNTDVREFNGANEIRTQAVTVGGTTVSPASTYAANGNTKDLPFLNNTDKLTLKHDAWNRLVSVSRVATAPNSTATLIYVAEHNALGWRTVVTNDHSLVDAVKYAGDTGLKRRTLNYYNERWQLVEQRIFDAAGSETAATTRVFQQFFGLRAIDDVVMRRTGNVSANGDTLTSVGTGLPRLTANGAGGGGGFGVTPVFQLTDLQFSVVAMMSPTVPYASPQVLARYSPYGETKFLALPAHSQ